MCVQISDKQVILEEVSYLLSIGFREDDKDLILLGMNVCRDLLNDDEWSFIEAETLRWHCKNFYQIGLEAHAHAKKHPKMFRSRGTELYQLHLRRWLCDKGLLQAEEDRIQPGLET